MAVGSLGIAFSSAVAHACSCAVQTATVAESTKLQRSFALPYLNTNPVADLEIDGHRIFRPAGNRRPIGHLLHFHGLGALSTQEIAFLHRLAAGKIQGEPVVVVAPLAQSLAPRDMSFNNLQAFYTLARFLRQQPREVRHLLVTNLISNRSLFVKLWRMLQTIGNPPWWYPFVFERAYEARDSAMGDFAFCETRSTESRRHSFRFLKHGALKPDFDATIKLMFKTVEEIAPRTDAVLEQTGAVRGHICASGFSQGVGPAIIFSAILRPREFCHLVLICASHVKTSHTPAMKDTDLKLDVILPRGDPVLATTGFRDAKIRRDLEADFRGRARIWHPPGEHSVEGHVAHIAGMQIVNSLRNSRRRANVERAANALRAWPDERPIEAVLESGLHSAVARRPMSLSALDQGVSLPSAISDRVSVSAQQKNRQDLAAQDASSGGIGRAVATVARASIVVAASMITILYNVVLVLGSCIPKAPVSRRSPGSRGTDLHLGGDDAY